MPIETDRPGRILIVRLSAFGDVVHCLPLLDALRRARPEAEIGWVVEEKAASLLEGHPQIDRLWVLPRARIEAHVRSFQIVSALRVLWGFLRELRAAGYELVIDAHCNLRASLTGLLSGAPRRIGFSKTFAKEGAQHLLTEHVEPRKEAPLKVQRTLELLRPLGIDGADARPKLAIPDAARARAEERLGKRTGAQVVAMHPGVSGIGAIKQWEPARYAAVARRLADEAGLRSVVTWGPGERALAEEVVAASAGAAQIGPETGSILDLAALLAASDLVIGSDSGPLHLAAALGVPVVGLYGPKDPEVYGPWDARTGEVGRVVRRPVHCSPCTLRTCSNWICMPAIQVDDVVAAALEELGRHLPRAGASAH